MFYEIDHRFQDARSQVFHLCREDHEQDVEQDYRDEELRPNQTKLILHEEHGQVQVAVQGMQFFCRL